MKIRILLLIVWRERERERLNHKGAQAHVNSITVDESTIKKERKRKE